MVTVNPLTLVVWALHDAGFVVILGLITLAVVAAFVVFGGGWS